LARAVREDAGWWLAAAIDDYESAQLLFKGGKYSKCIHVLHDSAEKSLKALSSLSGRGLREVRAATIWSGYTRWSPDGRNYPVNSSGCLTIARLSIFPRNIQTRPWEHQAHSSKRSRHRDILEK
jgi:hypothetical protein